MRVLSAVVLFSAVVTVSYGLRCYVSTSLDKNYKPVALDATTCPAGSDSYCIKEVIDGKAGGQKVQGSVFLCGPSSVCSDTKCHKNNGVNMCCCKGDLCNSGISLKYISAIASLMLVTLI